MNLWYDGKQYKGGGVQEILSHAEKYRHDSLVAAIEDLILKKSEYYSLLSVCSRVEQTILSVEAMEREVNNGGWVQFFSNINIQLVELLPQSLSDIGCGMHQTIAIGAIENRESEIKLAKYDRMYYDLTDDIAGRLLQYITKFKHEITLG